MKLVKTAEGKTQVKISRTEWEKIGQKAGWEKRDDRGVTLYWTETPDNRILMIKRPSTQRVPKEVSMDIIEKAKESGATVTKVTGGEINKV